MQYTKARAGIFRGRSTTDCCYQLYIGLEKHDHLSSIRLVKNVQLQSVPVEWSGFQLSIESNQELIWFCFYCAL